MPQIIHTRSCAPKTSIKTAKCVKCVHTQTVCVWLVDSRLQPSVRHSPFSNVLEKKTVSIWPDNNKNTDFYRNVGQRSNKSGALKKRNFFFLDRTDCTVCRKLIDSQCIINRGYWN
jgi:hypothetical protein